MKTFMAADLFCGAGGTSTGLLQACEAIGRRLKLVAVNHWERAVETHAANHPAAAHHCEDLTTLDPKRAVPGGRLDLLVASPECTHHSIARGGKPVNDQSRASAWCVLRWATALKIDRILIENVPEFLTWGPIGSNGRPLKSRRGETFAAFAAALRSLGYRVEWRVLNAADFGGVTTRRRLFLFAARGRLRIDWPDPTHAADPTPGLFGHRRRWRAAREVIDWGIPGQSIFSRKRPLSPNTLKRIEAGLRKFGGAAAEPFLVVLRRNMDARSLGSPVPAVLAGAGHLALCEPFLTTLNYTGSRDHDSRYSRSPNDPLPTVTSQGNRFGIVEPFITRVSNGGDDNCRNKSLETPLGTITTVNNFGLVEPFLLPHRQFDGMQVDDVNDPMRTITATNGGCNALVEPMILSAGGPDVDARPVSGPLPTVLARPRLGVCEPFLVPYYANGQADPVSEPVRTVTAKDRFGLAIPDGARFDIRFRMLQPHELASAMGFPAGYRITGNRSEQVRQIGNAVEVNQARALCSSVIGGVA